MDHTLNTDKKVFVAMSGGVDSAVSAVLLKEQGYDVTGVFMKNWSGDDFGIQADCPWERDQKDVEDVCKKFSIPFRSYNFEKEYREKVVEYFFDEIRKGRTPNPDVMCNKEIKFGIFLEKALRDGAELIATGHYARNKFNEKTGKYELLKGVDSNKDQSYFLHRITQDQLSKILFPIGEFEKPKVRELASEFGISVARKPDSQGICFIGEINVAAFLRANIKTHSGLIIDIDMNLQVGEHDGIEFYTIGQREGLKIGGAENPYFVVSKDKEKNILYVAQGKENKYLYNTEVKFSDLHLISGDDSDLNSEDISASIRYRQKSDKCTVDLRNGITTFEQKQRAIAEGQSIVLYNGDVCLGGGIINL